MSRESLVDGLIGELLDDISTGRLVEGEPIPSEAELAERFKVNRLTIREALRKMQAQGIIRTVPGRRSELNPVSQWVDIGAALRIVGARIGAKEASIQLLQLRRMIETEACGLAAPRMDEAALKALEWELDGMRTASAVNDVDKFVRHDIAFHDIILEASGNALLRILLDPLQTLLEEGRTQTSRVPEVQRNAVRMHAAIVEALRSGDARKAHDAMSAHITQTERDLAHYVLSRI
ncbi:FadR/GntR family transcriptional regulator [Actinomycetaceae bacterium L2_0104]